MPRVTGLGHVGLFVEDMPMMVDFYSNFLGLTVTDVGLPRIVFLSARPDEEHHEIALAQAQDGQKTNAQQISFTCGSLHDLKEFYRKINEARPQDRAHRQPRQRLRLLLPRPGREHRRGLLAHRRRLPAALRRPHRPLSPRARAPEEGRSPPSRPPPPHGDACDRLTAPRGQIVVAEALEPPRRLSVPGGLPACYQTLNLCYARTRMAPGWLWIVLTVWAAFAQTLRNAAQRTPHHRPRHPRRHPRPVPLRPALRAHLLRHRPHHHRRPHSRRQPRVRGLGHGGRGVPDRGDRAAPARHARAQLRGRRGLLEDGADPGGDLRRRLPRRPHVTVDRHRRDPRHRRRAHAVARRPTAPHRQRRPGLDQPHGPARRRLRRRIRAGGRRLPRGRAGAD